MEPSFRTPRPLLDAVEERFGKITIDLAATEEDRVAELFICPEDDSLVTVWPSRGVLWLNPPFANIEPWVKKCAAWRFDADPGAVLLLLVPASVDSNWWSEFVSCKARALGMSPRIAFTKDPYPKPIALCIYDPRFPEAQRSIEPWRWKP